jgi:DNA polymerase-3 subunit gamma/tau
VREVIIDQAGYQPISLKKKIYVIDEVHMLSTAAFNALLKTIEEPSGNVCFILATTELQKVPQTIVSRVQVFNFKKIPQDEMVAHLGEICKTE